MGGEGISRGEETQESASSEMSQTQPKARTPDPQGQKDSIAHLWGRKVKGGEEESDPSA